MLIKRLRGNIPPEAEEKSPHHQLREITRWLLTIPLIVIILFGCSQLSLLTSAGVESAETKSKLSAEYDPWISIPIAGFRKGLIDEIRMSSEAIERGINIYDDPVEESSTWIDVEPSPDDVVALPPENDPDPTELSGTEPPYSGDVPPPTETQMGEVEPSPTINTGSTNTPTPTNQPASTRDPGATVTFTPTPSSTPTPTLTATSTSSSTPTPTLTHTQHALTNTPTLPPPTSPPDYCANIRFNKVSVNRQSSSPDRLWKFYLNIYNDNAISVYLTYYQVSWSNDADIHLNRAKAIPNPDTGDRATMSMGSRSSPDSSCLDCPIEFAARPASYDAEIYNMYCNDYPCTEENPQNDIPAGTYNFTATGVFTFYTSDGNSVSCQFSESASMTQP
ncbi:MAG: hypothetical protein GTO18_14940 [Anaerolineales bacterium]|nr:hypothetical protein [Anaerolineales bacterium]